MSLKIIKKIKRNQIFIEDENNAALDNKDVERGEKKIKVVKFKIIVII